MDSLTQDNAAELWEPREPPCLSLYQPTHRLRPDNQQDPIRFRNLVKALEKSLLEEYPKSESRPLLDPFLALADDRDLWSRTSDGLTGRRRPLRADADGDGRGCDLPLLKRRCDDHEGKDA